MIVVAWTAWMVVGVSENVQVVAARLAAGATAATIPSVTTATRHARARSRRPGRRDGRTATHQATWRYGVHSRSDPDIGARAAARRPASRCRSTNSVTSRSSSCVPAASSSRRSASSMGERLAVRPRRGHRRERVADGQDARHERDLLAGQLVQVAVAIPALVVVADAGPDDVDVGQVADDQVAERDVLLDDRVFLGGQLAGLAQDRVRDADLADVVEQPGDPDGGDQLVRQLEPLGEEDAVAGDVLGVLLGVAILGVDREDQALEDVERAGLGLGRRRPRRPRGRRRRRWPWPPGG